MEVIRGKRGGQALTRQSLLLTFFMKSLTIGDSQMANYVSIAIVVTVLWISSKVIYRLYLSPISQVPGPRLAAITSLYEQYYDLVFEGRFPWQIDELHQRYGIATTCSAAIDLTSSRFHRPNSTKRDSHQ